MLSAIGLATAKMVTETYTSSISWVAPTGVGNLISVSGYGAVGSNGTSSTRVTSYDQRRIRYFYGHDGTTTASFQGITSNIPGSDPGSYCDPIVNTPSDPTYYSYQDCYDTVQTHSTTTTTPTTQGDSTTGFGQVFPGSYGAIAQSTTKFTNITVTPGSSYTLTVASGGMITFSYYK